MLTPVALIIFNRPDTTERVFEEIRRARPPKLLVVADGPRADMPGEAERCTAARAIIDGVDWDCEVLTNYSDVNLGCKLRPTTGLDWVFDTVPEAIIFEDDCLPDPTFFRFCDELLEKYRDDSRVAMISGNNFQYGRRRTPYSYYFSRYTHTWGWASWSRAWRNFDATIGQWPEIRDGGWLEDILGCPGPARYWTDIFERVYMGELVDVWDYQWLLACWAQGALTVLPNVNLISNIGFDERATHTIGKSRFSDMPTEPVHFPLSHPPFIVRDGLADGHTEAEMFSGTVPSAPSRMFALLKRLLRHGRPGIETKRRSK